MRRGRGGSLPSSGGSDERPSSDATDKGLRGDGERGDGGCCCVLEVEYLH